MKRLFCIVSIAVMLVPALGRTVLYTCFYANRAYIAEHLCEKRQQPASDCQGTCYLKKQLKKEAQREQQVPLAKKQQTIDLFAAGAAFQIGEVYRPVFAKPCGKPYALGRYNSPIHSIFHPPQNMV